MSAQSVFYDACDNCNDLTEVVSSYVSFCIDTNIPCKEIAIFPNNKPWVSKELKKVLNKKKRIFFTGNSQDKKVVSREVRTEIRKAKKIYREKIELQYSSGNLRDAWKGIKSMAAINQNKDSTGKHVNLEGVKDQELPNVLNAFYSRFEQLDFSDKISELKNSLSPANAIIISEDEVVKLLKGTDVRKAPGLDGICGRTLHHCAVQLGGVLKHIFQMIVDSFQYPNTWKISHIVPLPKNSKPRQPNDLRPIGLTSLIMKILEKMIKNEILTAIEGKLDPLQFAYQAGKGVEDAKIFILNALYKHLEKPNAHARLLFGDFSSAFNHMQPGLLIERLISDFKLRHQLILLILDFLTNRQQRVIVNGHLSDIVVTNIGSPQGCVLSPLLYILYAGSCRSSCDSSFLVKFSDDTVLLSLLQGAQHNHSMALPAFVDWCKDNFLELNASKTKDDDN